jgi:hypothetical protein
MERLLSESARTILKVAGRSAASFRHKSTDSRIASSAASRRPRSPSCDGLQVDHQQLANSTNVSGRQFQVEKMHSVGLFSYVSLACPFFCFGNHLPINETFEQKCIITVHTEVILPNYPFSSTSTDRRFSIDLGQVCQQSHVSTSRQC